jgi:hypothetical protein
MYPEPDLVETFLPNDLVNLLVGIPFFAAVLVLLIKDKLSGLLLLPGALIYVLYNYLAYLFSRPLGVITALNLGLVLLSLYTLFVLLSNIDHTDVKSRLNGSIPKKWSGWILVLIGSAFFFLACYRNINAMLTGIPLPLGEQVASLADLFVSSLWVGGGILLLRDRGLGYTLGLGLLTAASTLFLGLILFLTLSPLITGGSFDLVGVVTVLLMGLLCFVPTGFYLRAVLREGV